MHNAGSPVLSGLCTVGMLSRVHTQGSAVLVGRGLGFWESQAEGFAGKLLSEQPQELPNMSHEARRAIKAVPPQTRHTPGHVARSLEMLVARAVHR